MQDAKQDFKFNNLRFSRSYTAHVEYYSTLSSFCGPFTGNGFSKNASKLVDQWRARLGDLRANDWTELKSNKFIWARNCPPCCAKVISSKLMPCKLRICPFCHACKVSTLYKSVADYCLQNSANLYTYNRVVGRSGGVHLPIYKDARANTDFLLNNVLPRFVIAYRESFRRKFASKATGAIYWVKLEPVYESAGSFGVVGSWRIHYEAVLVSNSNVSFPEAAGKLKQVDYGTKSRRKHIAETVGYAFRYPAGWLNGPPRGMADLLNVSRRRRYLTKLGNFNPLSTAGATDGRRR